MNETGLLILVAVFAVVFVFFILKLKKVLSDNSSTVDANRKKLENELADQMEE